MRAGAAGGGGHKHVVVIGGSVAGLATALGLSQDGHRVTLIERDATPLLDSPSEAFERWDRRGSPQVRHSHAFLARLIVTLRERAPALLEQLLEAGAEELGVQDTLPETIEDRSPQPGDEDLVLLACGRVTFEWVTRRFVEARVDFRSADVVALEAERPASGPPRVTGVRIEEAGKLETIQADLVVDATGRRSKIATWLGEIGAEEMEEVSSPCGISYTSRFYRLLPGAERPTRNPLNWGDLGYLGYGIFPGDNGMFSISFGAPLHDDAIRPVVRTAPFQAAVDHIPATAMWADPKVSEPITDVHAMGSLRNTRRYVVKGGEPLALGIVAVGDALSHQNPRYGRGCSLGFVGAYLVVDALREHPDDVRAMQLAYEQGIEREIDPWYDSAVEQDRETMSVFEMQQRGEDPLAMNEDGPVDPRAYQRQLLRYGLVPALRTDATVLRAAMRAGNLLDTPTKLLSNVEVMRRVLACYQARHERVEPYVGPNRTEMIEHPGARLILTVLPAVLPGIGEQSSPAGGALRAPRT